MISEEAGITLEDINAFRQGSFNDATMNIQAKWYMVMLELLPIVCSKYTKAVRGSELAREFTTPSDETLVYWHLVLYGPTWEKGRKDSADATGKKGGKQVGEHYTRTKMDLFYDIFTRIAKAREDPDEGKDWDEAVREEARRRHSNGKTTGKPGEEKETTERTKRAYIVRFSPGKKMRVEKKPVTLHEV